MSTHRHTLTLLFYHLLAACTLVHTAQAGRERETTNENSPFYDKITDVERQKRRAWSLVTDTYDFLRVCYYMVAGPYVIKLYDSWIHFTWRLARYYQRFLILCARWRPVIEPYIQQAQQMVSAHSSSLNVVSIACLTSFLLGPVLVYYFLRSRTSSKSSEKKKN